MAVAWKVGIATAFSRSRRPSAYVHRRGGVYWSAELHKLFFRGGGQQWRRKIVVHGGRIGKAGEAARAAQSNRYIAASDRRRGAARQPAHRVRRGAQRVRAHEQRQAREQGAVRGRSSSASCARRRSALRDASSALTRAPEQGPQAPQRRARSHAAAADDRRRARAGAQRGSALEGARPAVRRRGGVRLQLDHRSGGAGAGVRAGLLSRPPESAPAKTAR